MAKPANRLADRARAGDAATAPAISTSATAAPTRFAGNAPPRDRRTRGTSASSRPTTRPTFLCPGPFTTSSACPAWAACARRARSRPPTSGP